MDNNQTQGTVLQGTVTDYNSIRRVRIVESNNPSTFERELEEVLNEPRIKEYQVDYRISKDDPKYGGYYYQALVIYTVY